MEYRLEYQIIMLARSLTGTMLANSIDHAKLVKDILILWLTYKGGQVRLLSVATRNLVNSQTKEVIHMPRQYYLKLALDLHSLQIKAFSYLQAKK